MKETQFDDLKLPSSQHHSVVQSIASITYTVHDGHDIFASLFPPLFGRHDHKSPHHIGKLVYWMFICCNVCSHFDYYRLSIPSESTLTSVYIITLKIIGGSSIRG